MKYRLPLFSLIFLVTTSMHLLAQEPDPKIESRVNALLAQMTLEEKVGQMAQVSIESLGSSKGGVFSFSEKMKDAVVNYKIGSILNTPGPLQSIKDWNRIISEIQQAASQTRLKIPVIYGLDHIHGVSYIEGGTLFPQPLAQAATWNRQLAYQAGVITAYESRAAGVPWTFSPALDLGTNPLWPRIWEGYGEDPYLVTEMGVNFMKGVQDPLSSKEKIAVSLKHYLAYSDPKSGKDRSDAWIPDHYLREYHLPPFAEAVKAGARNVMVNSALINGIPVHINKFLLTDVLKNELGFTGFVVTDWQDIENIYRRDRVTSSIKEAIALAINAGCDMSMIPYEYKQFTTDLVALVKEGKVSQNRIDDAVRRILRVKFELGLFETPVTLAKDYPNFGSEAFARRAYETASESITVLKNEGQVLPLKKGMKILVTGPNANSMRTLNGGWTYTWQGENTDEYGKKYNTVLEALINEFGKENIRYEPGVVYRPVNIYVPRAPGEEDSVVNFENVREAALQSDAVIICVGENSYTETPGNIQSLELSSRQQELVTMLAATGKPLILVLNQGRPRIINHVEPLAKAILFTYLPGNYGGDALADILSGDVNPSGKLPITYPGHVNDLTGYIHKPSEGATNPQGGVTNPQYPFGYGLSYTSFSYSGLSVNDTVFNADASIEISVNVTNTGNREGKEVIQLFTSDLIASFTPDVKRLRGFEKISLKPGETQKLTFILPVKQLAFVDPSSKTVLEAGEFMIRIGNLEQKISLNETKIF